MSEKAEDVKVSIPREMAENIQSQWWFKLYRDLEDFMLDAMRRRVEEWATVDHTPEEELVRENRRCETEVLA